MYYFTYIFSPHDRSTMLITAAGKFSNNLIYKISHWELSCSLFLLLLIHPKWKEIVFFLSGWGRHLFLWILHFKNIVNYLCARKERRKKKLSTLLRNRKGKLKNMVLFLKIWARHHKLVTKLQPSRCVSFGPHKGIFFLIETIFLNTWLLKVHLLIFFKNWKIWLHWASDNT